MVSIVKFKLFVNDFLMTEFVSKLLLRYFANLPPISIAIAKPDIAKINSAIIMFIEINVIVEQTMNSVNAIAVKRQIHVIKPIARNKMINKQKNAIAKQIEVITKDFTL